MHFLELSTWFLAHSRWLRSNTNEFTRNGSISTTFPFSARPIGRHLASSFIHSHLASSFIHSLRIKMPPGWEDWKMLSVFSPPYRAQACAHRSRARGHRTRARGHRTRARGQHNARSPGTDPRSPGTSVDSWWEYCFDCNQDGLKISLDIRKYFRAHSK